MGCCGQTVKDRDIQNAVNMSEIINIMSLKKENLINEKDQIRKHLEDKTNEVTLAKVDDLSDDELSRRMPYLDKLVDCYQQVIVKLKANKNVKLHLTSLYNVLYSCHLKKQRNIYITY